jgi:hypothetical protein
MILNNLIFHIFYLLLSTLFQKSIHPKTLDFFITEIQLSKINIIEWLF